MAEAHCNLGIVLKDLGHLDEARRQITKAIELAPRKAVFHFNLTDTKRMTAADPSLTAIEGLAREIDTLPADEQMHLHFALGKAYDDIGERDRSFSHLLAGNALKRRQAGYDEAGTLALFKRIQAVFIPELVKDKGAVGKAGKDPIFILGMPRSGTTLVEQILASHRQVFGAGELDLFEQATADLVGKGAFPEAVERLSAEDLEHLGRHYLAGLQAKAQGATRITDKMPRNFLFCGLIHLALPDARIIHTRRDPIDTCLSCFSKLFSRGHPYAYDLAELGRYYRGYEALMEHWRQVLPEGTLLEVRYEDVVADLEGQARRMLAFCGLEWDDACLAFHRTERPIRTASAVQVRQPIYQTSVGRWRPDADLLKPLTDELRPQ